MKSSGLSRCSSLFCQLKLRVRFSHFLCFLWFCMSFLFSYSWAQPYGWRDEKGVMNYSDLPPKNTQGVRDLSDVNEPAPPLVQPKTYTVIKPVNTDKEETDSSRKNNPSKSDAKAKVEDKKNAIQPLPQISKNPQKP